MTTTKKQKQPKAKKAKRGRPKLPPSEVLDYRVTLLLNDDEEKLFRKCLATLSKMEGKRVSGSAFVRRLVVDRLVTTATNLGVYV